MNLAIFRWDDVTFVKFVVAIIIAANIGYLPNYQRAAYKNTPVVTYSKYEDNTGYPVGSGFQYVTSVADMNEVENFAIAVDVNDLKPTNQYKQILTGRYYKNGFGRAMMNNEVNGIGQFYTVVLASGEKIIVFLDDTTIQLPKEGEVVLPVGKVKRVIKNQVFEEIQNDEQIAEENASWYVDMAGQWRLSKQAVHVDNMRIVGIVIGTVILIILQTILYKKLKIQ